MYKILFISQTSITVELENNYIYKNKEAYDVFINNELVLNTENNVFSLYNLTPNTTYELKIFGQTTKFKTLKDKAFINVKEFFVKGDGKTDDTDQIQLAINSILKGGRIYFPKGIYYVRPLFLRSNITLELHEEAIILASTDIKDYPKLPEIYQTEKGVFELSTWEGERAVTYASVITGINVENVNIIGKGTINASGYEGGWWVNHKVMKNGSYRPKGIFLTNCKNITLQGIKVKNTPSWNIHPFFSENLNILDIRLESPKDSPNTDGCNPEFCKNVNIIGVKFSVGDDCIALKSGKIAMGKIYKRGTENVTIRNCHMAFGHGAIVLGSEIAGGIKNIKVSQCYFESTDRGLRIKTRRGRGKYSVIDGITFENIYMDNVLTPLVMNMFYFCDIDGQTEYVWSKEALPIDDRTPYLGEFLFKDINCDNVHVAAGYFHGLKEQPIKKITLENVTFNYHENPTADIPAMMSFLEPMKEKGLIFNNVNDVYLKNVKINTKNSEKIEKDEKTKLHIL